MVDGSHLLQIEKVLKDFGEEKLSSYIAAELILRRDNKDCNVNKQFPETTSDLANLVFGVIDGKENDIITKPTLPRKHFRHLGFSLIMN